MTAAVTLSFDSTLLRPQASTDDPSWGFVVLPSEISEQLPRRGRTTVDVILGEEAFRVCLEPDGNKSHWMRIDGDVMMAAGVQFDTEISLQLTPVDPEPDPAVPDDLAQALSACKPARATWDSTTAIARVDWIHWITTAKQAKTRSKRINDACDMLAAGKKRVCCFDPSGFYSKAFSAPKARD